MKYQIIRPRFDFLKVTTTVQPTMTSALSALASFPNPPAHEVLTSYINSGDIQSPILPICQVWNYFCKQPEPRQFQLILSYLETGLLPPIVGTEIRSYEDHFLVQTFILLTKRHLSQLLPDTPNGKLIRQCILGSPQETLTEKEIIQKYSYELMFVLESQLHNSSAGRVVRKYLELRELPTATEDKHIVWCFLNHQHLHRILEVKPKFKFSHGTYLHLPIQPTMTSTVSALASFPNPPANEVLVTYTNSLDIQISPPQITGVWDSIYKLPPPPQPVPFCLVKEYLETGRLPRLDADRERSYQELYDVNLFISNTKKYLSQLLPDTPSGNVVRQFILGETLPETLKITERGIIRKYRRDLMLVLERQLYHSSEARVIVIYLQGRKVSTAPKDKHIVWCFLIHQYHHTILQLRPYEAPETSLQLLYKQRRVSEEASSVSA